MSDHLEQSAGARHEKADVAAVVEDARNALLQRLASNKILTAKVGDDRMIILHVRAPENDLTPDDITQLVATVLDLDWDPERNAIVGSDHDEIGRRLGTALFGHEFGVLMSEYVEPSGEPAPRCRNELRVRGEPARLAELLSACEGVNTIGEPSAIDFERISPLRVSGRGHLDCWGTSGGPFDVKVESAEASVTYRFTTEHTPPIPVVEALARRFPDLEFELLYAEPTLDLRRHDAPGFAGRTRFAKGEKVEDLELWGDEAREFMSGNWPDLRRSSSA